MKTGIELIFSVDKNNDLLRLSIDENSSSFLLIGKGT